VIVLILSVFSSPRRAIRPGDPVMKEVSYAFLPFQVRLHVD